MFKPNKEDILQQQQQKLFLLMELIFLSNMQSIVTKPQKVLKTHLHCLFSVCVGGSDPVDLHLPLLKLLEEKQRHHD